MALYLAIKSICRQIEDRYGSGKLAAAAAGVTPGVWSTYCNDDHPDCTIPMHRVPFVANASERAALAALILGDDGPAPASLRLEACEATEAAADAQRAAREAGDTPTPAAARTVRDRAAAALIEIMDVVRAAEAVQPGPRLRAVS
ncbi:hypothetical protein [Caulobacter segnis]|uniref:Uncharacterized protein n=1 Tax=Caulobacter segnis TaxID=88688 RepID=A0A2W5XFJ8_9CAUL|nr:hypothetical protein [Caulobacter segnis]PZR36471.1 MAG: hypothetical protein DI526_03265 [Caulobacter segnis]